MEQDIHSDESVDDEEGEMIVAKLESEAGKLLAITNVSPKQFRTGSQGFYAHGRVVIDGKPYQLNLQLVQMGSRKLAQTVGGTTS